MKNHDKCHVFASKKRGKVAGIFHKDVFKENQIEHKKVNEHKRTLEIRVPFCYDTFTKQRRGPVFGELSRGRDFE